MRFRTPLPSQFETLFADLFEHSADASEAPRPSHRFSVSSIEAAWGAAARARAMPEQPDRPRDVPRTAYGEQTNADVGALLDPYRILNDLGIEANSTEAEIAVFRRAFALRNHPDRVPAELREIATQRMMVANDLIDRHLAKLRRPDR